MSGYASSATYATRKECNGAGIAKFFGFALLCVLLAYGTYYYAVRNVGFRLAGFDAPNDWMGVLAVAAAFVASASLERLACGKVPSSVTGAVKVSLSAIGLYALPFVVFSKALLMMSMMIAGVILTWYVFRILALWRTDTTGMGFSRFAACVLGCIRKCAGSALLAIASFALVCCGSSFALFSVFGASSQMGVGDHAYDLGYAGSYPSESEWGAWRMEDRLAYLDGVTKFESARLGIDAPDLYADAFGQEAPSLLGRYFAQGNKVEIGLRSLREMTRANAIATVCHEVAHAYQNAVVSGSSTAEGDSYWAGMIGVDAPHAEVWRAELSDYRSASSGKVEDVLAYESQDVETSADEFGVMCASHIIYDHAVANGLDPEKELQNARQY